MKMAPAKVTSDAASSAASLNRMRNTNVFFRKLSLNADRNCVQKSGANRRDVIRWSFMVISPARNGQTSISELTRRCRAVRPWSVLAWITHRYCG